MFTGLKKTHMNTEECFSANYRRKMKDENVQNETERKEGELWRSDCQIKIKFEETS